MDSKAPKKDSRVTRLKKEEDKEEVKVKPKHFKTELLWNKHKSILYT